MQKMERDELSPSLVKTLGIRSFRFLWIGQIFSQLGANMLLSLLALRVYEVTKSNTAVSALYITYGLPAVLFGMFAGVIVDHVDRRKVLIVCNIGRTILMILLLFFHNNIFVIYVVMFLNSFIGQLYFPAEAPLIPRLVPEKHLLTANSLFTFTFFSTIALGFVLAGPVLKYTSAIGSFSLLISFYLIAIWAASNIPRQREDSVSIARMIRTNGRHVLKRVVSDIFQGVLFAIGSRRIADALLLLTETQIVLAILGTLGPGFADQVLKVDVTDASLIVLGPAVLGIIAGALWVGNFGVSFSPRQLTSIGLFGGGSVLLLLSSVVWVYDVILFSRSLLFVLMFILFFLLGFSNSLLDVPSNATLQNASVGGMRGRVYGILTSVIGGIGILPVVAGGILADTVGIQTVLVMLGFVISAYGMIRMKFSIIR